MAGMFRHGHFLDAKPQEEAQAAEKIGSSRPTDEKGTSTLAVGQISLDQIEGPRVQSQEECDGRNPQAEDGTRLG